MKLSRSKLLLVFAVLLISASGVIGFYVWNIFSAGGIDIKLVAEGQKLIGQSFDLKVAFSNNSSHILETVRVTLQLPDGLVASDGDPDQKVVERDVGSVDIGSIHQEIFKIMVVPSEANIREVKVAFSYSPAGLTARFVKVERLKVDVEPLPVELSLKAPEKVFSGEEFEIAAEYQANSQANLSPLSLAMVYPQNFTKLSEDLKQDKSGAKLRVRGQVNLPDNAVFEIKARLLANLLGRDYPVLEKAVNVSIAPSPLSFKLKVNGSDNVIAYPADRLEYTLIYKNNTKVDLQGIVIKAKLAGEMFDLRTLDGRGAKFNLVNRTLTWDASVFEEQRLLPPGEERSVNFSVSLRDAYPIKKLNDKNFTIKVEATIESPTVPYLVAADKTTNYAVLETKVGGSIKVDAFGLFRDASAGILNKGPWPPKVGRPTQYTIHWTITNYSTDVRDIEIRATLQDGVVATGVVKSNTTSAPQVGSESGEVVWRIDRLVATTGLTGEKPEAIFQVEATPTPDKRGSYLPLLSVTQVKAFDEFTGSEIVSSSEAVTSRLPADPTIVEGQGIVVE